jgi:hypothetical protein
MLLLKGRPGGSSHSASSGEYHSAYAAWTALADFRALNYLAVLATRKPAKDERQSISPQSRYAERQRLPSSSQ